VSARTEVLRKQAFAYGKQLARPVSLKRHSHDKPERPSRRSVLFPQSGNHSVEKWVSHVVRVLFHLRLVYARARPRQWNIYGVMWK
jgi:hypothetical protein